VLFDISVVPGATHAIVSWTSTNPATSQVLFGLTTNYGTSTFEDAALKTSHSMLLSGLAPGTTYHFAVQSRVGASLLRSAGWSFRTAGELVLDNTEAAFTGNWSSGNSAPDKFGADYRFAGTTVGGSTASALYVPDIRTEGAYDVFVWYPQGGNRSTNTPVSIFFQGGTLTARVNQETGGGGWRQVGTNLLFRAGTNGFVRISNGTGESNQVVMADAVRFVYRAEQDAPAGPTAPAWWTAYYLGAGANLQLDADADGYASWEEYLAGTVPTNAASRLQFWSQTVDASRLAIFFHPLLSGRNYQLEERNGSEPWAALPQVPVPAANGAGVFSITNAPGTVKLYRLKIGWAP
jgi:hypothetical protein